MSHSEKPPKAQTGPLEAVVVPAPALPQPLPRCEHGGRPGWCNACQRRDQQIAEKVGPLVDEFWAERGQRDLGHLMLRAYRMGMRAALEVTTLKVVWQGWHHNFEVTGPGTSVDGVVVMHVTDASMHALLGASEDDLWAAKDKEGS